MTYRLMKSGDMTEVYAKAQREPSGGSTCVRMPGMRIMLRRYAPIALVLLGALVLSQVAAEAQGLIGAPCEVRYGQSYETNIESLDYGTACGYSHLATAITAIGGLAWCIWRNWRTRAMALSLLWDYDVSFQRVRRFMSRRRWQSVLFLLLAPLVMRIVSMYWVNNAGGLSGGL